MWRRVKETTLKANYSVNSELGVTVICDCWFISCTRYTTQVENSTNEGGIVCVQLEIIWDLYLPLSFFKSKDCSEGLEC